MRKLGRAAEAAVNRIELGAQRLQNRIDGCAVEISAPRSADWLHARKRGSDLFVLRANFAAFVAPELRNLGQHLRESREAMARYFGKISAAEEGSAVRRQEHGERPAAAAAREHLV